MNWPRSKSQVRALAGWSLVLFAAACNEEPAGGTNAGGSSATSDGAAADVGTVADTGGGDGVIVDAGADCPGGAGCPCAAHGDCDLPLCIVAPEGARCARACVEACPGGQRCVLYNGGGVDGATICAPAHGLSCRPCEVDAQCRTVGAEDAACVSQGANGSFCGVACQADGDCPGEMACKDALSSAGKPVRQCVPAKGACSCSSGAVVDGAQTVC
ncbi:MAG: hypothetical protein H6747_09515 [Deltaproteobacteria bacterium]|nr:hypothetical protein [Deltaproteobacteria bacterium]